MPSTPRRVAVIDIGSASARLLVADVSAAGRVSPILERRRPTRLAEGLDRAQRLSAPAVRRTVDALRDFVALARRAHARSILAHATAAVRDARNQDAFLLAARRLARLDVRVVSARDECVLAAEAAAHAFDLDGPFAVADLGGGSLDLALGLDALTVGSVSLPLGAVRLTDTFGGPDAAAGPRFNALRLHVRRTLAEGLPDLPFHPRFLAATGGGFTSLLTMAAARRAHSHSRAHHPAHLAPREWEETLRSVAGLGAQPLHDAPRLSARDLAHANPVALTEIRAILRDFRDASPAERREFPGLPPDRVDIAAAALVVVDETLRALHLTHVHVFPGGIRQALARRAVRTEASRRSPTRRLAQIRDLARRARYPRAHSEHVTALALDLLDRLLAIPELAGRFPEGERAADRELLRAASILHDVGVLVSYSSHHKHSAEIIRHADLPAWSDREKDLIAQVARYHRRSIPAPRHAPFAALPRADRDRVRRLAAVLRVADGLDRDHLQRATFASLAVSGRAVVARVSAHAEIAADLAASRKKSDLFEEVFRYSWHPRRATAR